MLPERPDHLETVHPTLQMHRCVVRADVRAVQVSQVDFDAAEATDTRRQRVAAADGIEINVVSVGKSNLRRV